MQYKAAMPQIPLAVFKANMEYQISLTHLANDSAKRCMDFNETCHHLATVQVETWWERMHALSSWPHSGLAPFEIGTRQFQSCVQGVSTLQAQAVSDHKALVEGLREARMAWQQTFFDAVGNSESASEI